MMLQQGCNWVKLHNDSLRAHMDNELKRAFGYPSIVDSYLHLCQ